MNPPIEPILDGIDWEILRAQKATLVKLAVSDRLLPDDKEDLDGIINLIDSVQDMGVEWFGADSVFGRSHLRRQRIVLDVTFDPSETDEPGEWNWDELLDTPDVDHARVIDGGCIREVHG